MVYEYMVDPDAADFVSLQYYVHVTAVFYNAWMYMAHNIYVL